jgi:molybdopterin/thiamine biosynthesis adenylyltransferase
MGVIRLPEPIWKQVRDYLLLQPGEHFAFLLASTSASQGEPLFDVKRALLVPEWAVSVSRDGYNVNPDFLVEVVNEAVRAGYALIEAHNHGGSLPRFSRTDREGFAEFPEYVLSSLPGRPYAATVWGDETVFGEYFLPGARTGTIRSILRVGGSLSQLISRNDDLGTADQYYARQIAWLTEAGQRSLGRLRVGIVGAGGTGSILLQNLVYLGVRDFLLVEDDSADVTSMNRLVTATAADLEHPKVLLGSRLVRSVQPSARVQVINRKLQSAAALDALKGADVLFGCVDNDGARLVLNEIALAYSIPLFDLGVGLLAEDGRLEAAGGRLAVVIPGGPCLHCMGQLDLEEARYFVSDERARAVQRQRGYVTGLDVPALSVISLNGITASMACNEFAVFVSGTREVSYLTEFDLLGSGRVVKAQSVTPVKVFKKPGCIQCSFSGQGDDATVERYGDKYLKAV